MNRRPLTIEFTGLPNAGKTTLIHNLQNLLSRNDFSVKIMREDAELVPKEIPKKTWIKNVWITFCISNLYVLKNSQILYLEFCTK